MSPDIWHKVVVKDFNKKIQELENKKVDISFNSDEEKP